MTVNKDALNKLFTVIGIFMAIGLAYQLYVNYINYPTPPHFSFWSIAQITVSIAMTVITYILVMVSANIVSLLNTILTVFNTVIFIGLCKLSSVFVKAIQDQPSIIEYSTKGSLDIFKILIYIIMAILLLLWLKYFLVVRHNLAEQ